MQSPGDNPFAIGLSESKRMAAWVSFHLMNEFDAVLGVS
jgi:hypothetical protein